ncbi:MAG: regulatory protein TetR [Acidimicrobiales bacterium]|nr:regulatory protein TetR [Acidimicrobiales bacterium]
MPVRRAAEGVAADAADAPTRRAPFGTNPLVGERGSETERRIFQGALEVFGEVGYNDARVELITQRAGCSRPAFYQYFSSKDDVYWKLARDLGIKMTELGGRLPTIDDGPEGVARLAEWIDEFTTLYQDHAPIFAAFQAASRGHEELAQQSAVFGVRLDHAFLRAFGRRDRRADQALASGMAAVLIRCSFYWMVMAASGDVDRQQLVDGLAQVVHRLFHGPIPGVNIERVRGGRRAKRIPRPVIAPIPASSHDRPMRPRGEQTRRRLLDAGAQVLPARGYHDARVDDIVAAAGVSHGSFYRYFDDKDDFFRALAQEAGGQMVELLGRLPVDGDVEELRAWLEEWFDSYQSNGGVITTWQEMQEAGDELVAFSQRVAASITTALVTMLEARGFGDALVDALILLALIERLPYRAFTLGFITRRAAVDATVTIVRRGLMAQPA